MLGFLRPDPTKKLEKLYAKKMEEARDAQRAGKIPLYANIVADAEKLGRQIDELKSQRS